MTRTYQHWTPEINEQFTHLVHQGVSNIEIARILERTIPAVNIHKFKLGLVVRPETCQHCQAPISTSQVRSGRPPRFCSRDCARAADKERREALTRAAAKAREGRICENADCSNPLPTNNAQRRFCSRLCAGRTHELTYQRPGKEVR